MHSFTCFIYCPLNGYYFLNIWDGLRSSYWFIPSILVLIAICFSIGFPWLDNEITDYQFPGWIKTTTDSARATLSTITGAMVAVTGTVFSITIVTLSLTSQQFGPRLLRTFMLDQTTQITLGIFLSTALYSSLILHIVEKQSGGFGPPHLSVLFAVLLMIISVIALIIFIHHVAVLIQAPRIVENVSKDLNDAIVRLFPETLGEESQTEEQCEYKKIEKTLSKKTSCFTPSQKEGYIQALNGDGILTFAVEENLVVRFLCRPGDFISLDTELAEVFGEVKDYELLIEKLNQSIIVGMRRTPRQDLECTIHELVEVAVRSLSPGINDPFTAINCIDRLGAALRRLATRATPSSYRYDSEGILRLIMIPTTFPSILNAALNQIRQYSASSVAVLIRLLEILNDIAQVAVREKDRKAIELHANMIHRMAKNFPEEQDRNDMQIRYDTILKSLSGKI